MGLEDAGDTQRAYDPMTLPDLVVHLAEARDHVTAGERLVSEQRRRIAVLARRGYSTELATQLLATLESTLATMRDHLAFEEKIAAGV